MKRFALIIINIALIALPTLAFAGAQLQVIHNSADPAAAEVDVYVNGDLLLDNFAFRTATPFVDVPSGVELSIAVAPGNSNSVDDALATFGVTLANGGRYLAVANGVLDPSSFAENPDGRSTGFTLFLQDHMASRSWWGTVKLRAVHGSSDAPAVDIRSRIPDYNYSTTLYGGVSYGDIGGTRTVFARDRIIDVTLPGQPDAIVASYEAPLSSLARKAIVVFASGFLTPDANQGGEGFGLFAALDDGTVVALPLVGDPTARLQVIHNAADPAANEVDVYVNGDLLLNDFAFRTATPFIDVPAGVTLNVGIAPGNSESADDALAVFPLVLDADRTYVAMATGVLSPADFADNPSGNSIGFTIQPLVDARERGFWGRAAIVAYHGATDAPAVDIRRATYWGSRKVFGDLSYGEFSSYKWLRAKSYTLQVTPAGDRNTVVAAFTADLSGLAGGAAVVFASGFLTPDANNGGAAFGLLAALPDGTVLTLPPASKASGDFDKAGDFIAAKASLEQNYPNPFNPMTTIAFSLPREGRVSLKVFDMRGRLVQDVLNESRGAGRHEVTFDGTRLASGMYMYQVVSGDFTQTRRMMLVK
jgi:hypothetical protein